MKKVGDGMIWFTTDLYSGQRATVSMCEWPFSSVEEMNDTAI